MKHEESSLQIACVTWWRRQYPQYSYLLFSSLNGTHLSGTAAQRAIKWNRLAREGAVSGVADITLLMVRRRPAEDPKLNSTFSRDWHYHGLQIEMKSAKGKQSPEQKKFQKQVEAQGYEYFLCRDLESFIAKIKEYV